MNDMAPRESDDENWACIVRAFPTAGVPRVQDDLRVSRAKPRSLVISLAYRLVSLARRLFGDEPMLRFSLNAAWLFRQFAYQLSYRTIGPAFLDATHGISKELLKAWIPPGASVIDIGCGYGRLCRLVAPYASRVVGVDYDPHRIELARRHTVGANIEYRVADATTGLGHEEFDAAILSHALEHIDDVGRLLHDVAAKARLLIVEVPDFDGDCLNAVRRDLGCRWYTDNDHVREYTLPLLQDAMHDNGWKVMCSDRRGGMLAVVAVRAEHGAALAPKDHRPTVAFGE
jgi:SAM-dependent methyltransferase